MDLIFWSTSPSYSLYNNFHEGLWVKVLQGLSTWYEGLSMHLSQDLIFKLFCQLSTNKPTTVVIITEIFLQNEIKTVYTIVKYKTNYLYSINDYTVINWIIEAALREQFLLISGESLFIKMVSLKDSLNALFSQRKIEKWLKLLLLCSWINRLCSCNNRWSDIADGLHATLFPVRGDKPICSPDITFKWCFVLP